ncbi:MAG: AmmeMemoRadiSam system protein B, partial [Candidatus Aminicenantes bacterium]|nr:AmmeMemoRadiSam system protein B [Candidatus Aminicenantes bacterium]
MGTKRILAGLMLFFFLFSFLGAEKIRDYLATGSWYPASKTELNSLLSVFFEKAEKINISGTIRGIVAPHAGFSYSGQCAARVYKQFQEQSSKINRIIILGSSHHSGFYGACVSNFTHNATPLGNIPLDRSIMEKLSRESHFQVNNRVMQYEHSIENQLPFLQMIFKDRAIKIVPILFGQLDRKDFSRMANIIRQFVNSKTLVVASTDLNHYGRTFDYTPFTTNIKQNLTRLDQGMIKHITDLDFKGYLDYKQKTGITMCGFVPVGVLMSIFSKKHHRGYLIDYCKSGDRNNDYSLSVSYASLVISEKNPGHSGGSTGNESSR